MKYALRIFALLVTLAASDQVQSAMSLTQGLAPASSTSAFIASGTHQSGNVLHYAIAKGGSQTPHNLMPNFWLTQRSWELSWDHANDQFGFTVFSDDNYTTVANSTLTRTPRIAAGNTLLGLDIGARLVSSHNSVTISDVEFNGGSGFSSVATANATYSGNAFFNNFHAISGTLGNFSLRGKTIMAGTVSPGASDSLRFFVDARQGGAPIPEPGTIVIWSLMGGMGVVSVLRRRKA